MAPGPAEATTPAAGLLSGHICTLEGQGCASRYAVNLLASLGAQVRTADGPEDVHPALAWARSGLMWLTGGAEQQGQMLPAPVAACANGVVKALSAMGAELPEGWRRADEMLAHRAALLGLRRQGRISAGGSCRLLEADDGMLAVNLARSEDWTLLPAWMDGQGVTDWDELAAALALRTVDAALERGRLLGLPVAAARMPMRGEDSWCRVSRNGVSVDPGRRGRPPRVLDLSSLWAGPLCSQLLHQLGAQVIKVESTRRPDGARFGNQAFFDLVNGGKTCVALDLTSADGIARLRELVGVVDIVMDSSRPRALRQLGVDAAEMVATNAGLSWVSITGYGRDEPAANWVAFGDDVGVCGGLSALLARAGGGWSFCGDAIGDPLTGLHAALAAWCAYSAGGGAVVALSMRDVVARCAVWEPAEGEYELRARSERWESLARSAGLVDLRPPRPALARRARALGADNAALAELLAC